jgi:PAS domain S-box-containing protein
MPHDAASAPEPSDSGRSATPIGILQVVLLYAVFAALWILLSDQLMEWALTHPAHIILASTLKGWAFVAVTSLLLYGLMQRLLGAAPAKTENPTNLRPLLLPLILLATAIIALTATAIGHTVIRQKEKETARLQAIADLKSRQIKDWLDERLGDARFVQSSHFWAELYHRWRDKGDAESGDRLRQRMDEFLSHNAIQAMLLLDPDGRLLWDSHPNSQSIVPALESALTVFKPHDQRITIIGPDRDDNGRMHLDFIVPLMQEEDRQSPRVILHIDPASQLFPILETWPVPSSSGESLLFRRDGEQILYLSALRHRPDSAGTLRLPITEANLLAARALRSEVRLNSLVEGVDYRGEPVLGVIRAIEETDWFLVAKIDQAELYSETIHDVLWIGLAGLIALFMSVTGAYLFRQRQELIATLREQAIQAEKLRTLQLLDAIAESSTDAIFAKDTAGRYLLFNQAAARIMGKSVQQVIGQDDTTIFPPRQAAAIRADDRRVMTSNSTSTFEQELSAPDGDRTLLTTKGPLRDTQGNIIGIFGISRNVTERKQAELALHTSLQEKVALLKEVHHRVKNNLQIVASLLNLQSGRSSNAEVVDVLQDTRNRVRSMALLHEALYRSENLARINFAVYVNDLCAQLLRSCAPVAERVTIEKKVAPIGLDLEYALPCGLIINELVTNGLKHGFPYPKTGCITVDLHEIEHQQLVLQIHDSGVGLPPDFDLGGSTTLGLKLIMNLADQLGSQLVIERPPNGGTAFSIVFSVPYTNSAR